MLPLDHDEDFLAPELPAELEMVLRDLFGLVNHAFGGGSFNLSLHRIPELDFHWHFELQPRLTQMAALEIGADIYVNSIAPQASAAHWRGEI